MHAVAMADAEHAVSEGSSQWALRNYNGQYVYDWYKIETDSGCGTNLLKLVNKLLNLDYNSLQT